MLKRSVYLAATIVLAFSLAWFASPSYGHAAEIGDITGKWGGGIRAGGSFFTQDINNDTPGIKFQGNNGLAFNAQAFYGVSKNLAVGFMIDWNRNSVDLNVGGLTLDLGTLDTVSLMPYAELRTTYDRLAPYLGVGLGVNLNSFSVDSGTCAILGGNCSVSPDDTFAFRVAGGTDYFLSERIALNAELGWKRNSGDVTVNSPGLFGTGDFNGSVLTLMVGVRAYFE